jgi:tetratricopeptide (TPR) repeat protein
VEETEGPEADATGTDSISASGVDPVGVALALSGASREQADAFLSEQRTLAQKQCSLIDIQEDHLHEQFKQLHLSVWEKRLGVLLRLATAVVGLAVASTIALMVWDAKHSRGLIIAPFSVPPSLQERGLGGEVIASQLIDKLNHMAKSESSRAVQSYANNWGENIKVEIPETGVSVGELRNFLREWLGHDIRITGEVYNIADGIAVTARTGGEEGATFTGRESDLEALVQQAAEHVYEVTQPYRYANYLDRNFDPKGSEQRVAKAKAIYWKLIAGDDPQERAWAFNGLGTIASNFEGDQDKAIYYYRRALDEVPDFLIATFAIAARSPGVIGDEERYRLAQETGRGLHGKQDADLNPHFVPYATVTADWTIAFSKGDYRLAVALARTALRLPDDFATLGRANFVNDALSAMARGHDLVAFRAFLRELDWRELPPGYARVLYAAERQDWRDLLLQEKAHGQAFFISARRGALHSIFNALLSPYFALAHAELGDFAGAERLIAPSAGYMDAGVQVRAQIAELQGQHARADFWFARAEAMAPSLPFADALWGQALVKRGEPDAAIKKFKLSSQKGPHFADPLEGWGEALMAKNQSHLALAKFSEADKYAPNWGRLHLKWGEALYYAGKTDEAIAQFARAAQLDLTPADKAELARHLRHA